ncbi:Stress response protein SCP2 [Actinacidiphila yanglinensis]|uniref:Stress response protein SCP2 n=1 Tax=Actinacidiphila yanglinensis TaxID=310779 RepID=A0A1H5YR64_9ACTN|nr:VWA domain-containing protein [Actinacidiphila yanglinensis]SEG26649.1 Stress response protein SCP2 [Actinacidiphila yanglinensis]
MEALSLSKGGNAALESQSVALQVATRGTPADVSALLLGANGKVRSDDDLVFYNHPEQSGVSLSGGTVTADLPRIPADVGTVVVVASVDPSRPGTVFTTAPVLTATQADGTGLAFTPPDFAAGETVVVLVEIYRRSGGWKVRAVGQGYASGLAGLATDYGVHVDPEPSTSLPRPRGPGTSTTVSDVDQASLSKVAAQAPALLATTRQATQALARSGAAGRHAAVYLILDHDWATKELYESFAVQAFAERVLALSVNLDDDGTVPVIFSSGKEPFLEEIRLDNYPGRIGRLHTQVGWGWGDVGTAMRTAVDHYQESGAEDPAFVIVHVGDEPWDKSEFRSVLQNTSDSGVFWLFVGFGHGKLAFFKNLNASTSARFANVAFFEASKNPEAVPDETFYAGLLEGFGTWMSR